MYEGCGNKDQEDQVEPIKQKLELPALKESTVAIAENFSS